MQSEVIEDGVRLVECSACFPALKDKVAHLLRGEGEKDLTDDDIARILYLYNRGTEYVEKGGSVLLSDRIRRLHRRLVKLVIESGCEREFDAMAQKQLSALLPKRDPPRLAMMPPYLRSSNFAYETLVHKNIN